MLSGKRYIYKSLLSENLESKREPFISEREPKLLTYSDELWRKVFPVKKNTEIKNYMLSNIGIYSIIYPNDADKIAKIIKSFVPKKAIVTDATGNMGGITLALTNYFDKVNSVEIIPLHCKILENNMKVYDVVDKVKIHCIDYLDIGDKLEQDVVFLDPPWGGPEYKSKELMELYLDNISISDIIKSLLNKNEIKIIAIRVPFNYDFKKILALTEESRVFIFKNPMGGLNFFLVILIKQLHYKYY
jgi:predicted RNA methylase